MTNQDPIADREAKIAAWRKKVRVNKAVRGAAYTWDSDSDNAWTLSSAAVQEAVALMRSAPQDGDAKLRELRDWACESSCDTDCGDAVRLPPLLREIDRLLSKPSEPAPSAEIDRLRAENARLQADLAAAVKAHQFAEASQKVEQVLAKSAEARVAHLERDLAAARADQAAMARRELEWMRNWCWNSWGTVPGSAADRVFERRLAALPAQQPEPKPDAATRDDHLSMIQLPFDAGEDDWRAETVRAVDDLDDRLRKLERGATRDGDEVLRGFLARDDSGAGMTIDEAVMRELCRRELARGGK